MPSLMIGVSLANAGQTTFLDPSSTALFARFTTPPTQQRMWQINALINALKVAGVWSKIDALYVMAAADAQAAQRNWKADAYNLTPVNAPTFTADRGYQGDGLTKYLSTGFVPASAGGQYTLNSAHLSVWSRTSSAAAQVDIGARSGSNTNLATINTFNGSSLLAFGLNSAVGTGSAMASGAGYSLVSRVAGATVSFSKNGAALSNIANAVDAMPGFEFFVGASNAAGSPVNVSARQLSVASIGSGLTSADVAALYTAINTYLVAVGAA